MSCVIIPGPNGMARHFQSSCRWLPGRGRRRRPTRRLFYSVPRTRCLSLKPTMAQSGGTVLCGLPDMLGFVRNLPSRHFQLKGLRVGIVESWNELGRLTGSNQDLAASSTAADEESSPSAVTSSRGIRATGHQNPPVGLPSGATHDGSSLPPTWARTSHPCPMHWVGWCLSVENKKPTYSPTIPHPMLHPRAE